MRIVSWYKPRTMAGQMILVLSLSLSLLLVILAALEFSKQETVLETALSRNNLNKIQSLFKVLDTLNTKQITNLLALTSTCHRGQSLTQTPYPTAQQSVETIEIKMRLIRGLNLEENQVQVDHVILTQKDFSYAKCKQEDMNFPIEGLVISIKLSSGHWFNSEIHPHELHLLQDILYWAKWSGIAFFFIGGIAIFFISHLNKPLGNLTRAANEFAKGLKISKVEEIGPPDIRRTIQSFNAMQQQVTDEINRRTTTLAAISHDIRTPLTALRIKAELIDDEQDRESLISSINKMEKVTASALEFLKGENRTEPMRNVELSTLLESECLDFSELGENVRYLGEHSILQLCRPEALARAARNLIENAIKFSGAAVVRLTTDNNSVTISVLDNGPGIPEENIDLVIKPFNRLSKARESDKGGFGLGLAIVEAIAQGHNTHLTLEPNQPTGLIASIKLNRQS